MLSTSYMGGWQICILCNFNMAAILLFLHASCTFFNPFEISSSFSFNLSFSTFNVWTVSFRIFTISYSKFIYFCVQLKSFRSCVRSIRTHAHHSSRRFGETWRDGTLFTDCRAEMILSTLIVLIRTKWVDKPTALLFGANKLRFKTDRKMKMDFILKFVGDLVGFFDPRSAL